MGFPCAVAHSARWINENGAEESTPFDAAAGRAGYDFVVSGVAAANFNAASSVAMNSGTLIGLVR